MVKLGDRVKDTVSGFSGIAVAKTTYLQGCDRIAVQAITKKNKEPISWQHFDEPQLKVVKRGVVKQGSRVTGGYKPSDGVQKDF